MAVLDDQELLVILDRARALLTDSSRWSGRHYAEDETGRWTPVGSAHAARFNLEGGLIRAAGRDTREALVAAFKVFGEVSPQALVRLKTSSPALTHAEALSLLDDAMAHLSAPPIPKNSEIRPIAGTSGGDDGVPEGTATSPHWGMIAGKK